MRNVGAILRDMILHKHEELHLPDCHSVPYIVNPSTHTASKLYIGHCIFLVFAYLHVVQESAIAKR